MINLGIGWANERWCDIVTSSLTGWVHTPNDPSKLFAEEEAPLTTEVQEEEVMVQEVANAPLQAAPPVQQKPIICPEPHRADESQESTEEASEGGEKLLIP